MVEAEEQRMKERQAAAKGKEHQAMQHRDAANKKEEKAEREEEQNKQKA